jgi:uncharacterized OB-fold protein
MTTAARPADTAISLKAFFEGVREGRIVVQRCTGCRTLAVPPKLVCPHCQALTWEPAPLTGDGAIVSYTIIRVPPSRLAALAPYAIVVVRMVEGVSLLGRLADVPLDAVAVGLPVRLAPGQAGDDPPVIRFRAR